MANGGRIQYTVGFNVDQSGLKQAKSALQEIQKMPLNKFDGTKEELNQVKKTAKDVETALKNSFNADLGTINVSKFNQNLKSANITVQQMQAQFAKAGAAGQNALRGVTAEIATTKTHIKQTNKFLEDMGQTMKNTIKWGISSGAWNTMTNAIQGAYNYAKKLDTSLNAIRIVTGKSADDMERFAVQANKAAKNLGQSTTSYTNASLIYYQQGLEDAEVQARTETTLKAANVTGQSAAEVSEQLTAVWNGYKVNAEEAELYVDKLAAVAATTAADLEELSTGMSKVASAANLMGVDMDQLNAQLATIVSVTRQAPESVGTALKTIYARMGDIEAGIDTETTLGNYTEQMAAMGFNVLDANGQLRDMGEVIEEIGGKWTTLSREQQVALSQVMAGTRQYNNLLSLFDNWDMYTNALNTSATAAGTLQNQQEVYMESMEAHLQQLSTAGERVYNSLFDANTINPLIDALTGVVSLVGDLIDGFGGGGNVLLALGGIATRVFKKQIGESIASTIINIKNEKEEINELQASIETLNQIKILENIDDATKAIANMGETTKRLAKEGLISEDELEKYNILINRTKELGNTREETQKKLNDIKTQEQKALSTVSDVINTEESPLFDEKDVFKKIREEQESNKYGFSQTQHELLKQIQLQNEEYQKRIGILQEVTQAQEKYEKSLTDEEETKNLDKYNKKLSGLSFAAQDILNEGALTDDMQKSLQEALDNFRNSSAEDWDETAEALQNAYSSAITSIQERLKQLEVATKNVSNSTEEELTQTLQSTEEEVKKNQQAFDSLIENVELNKITMQVTDVIGATTALVAGVNGVREAFEIWGNEDLTFTEKLTQSVMGLATALPLVYANVNTVIGGMKGLKSSIPGAIAAIHAKAAAIDEAAAAERRETEANLAGAASETADTAANVANAASEELDQKETTESTIAEGAETAGNLAGAASEIADTAANVAGKGSGMFKGLGKSLTKIGGQVISKAGPVLAVTAVIAAIVGSIAIGQKMATAALDEAVAKAEKANKKAQQLQESYNQVNTELSEMKQAFSGYNESQKAIDDMIVGTEEWKQAIKEANAEVLTLMSNYEGLSAYITNENGRLVISEEGQEKILAEQEEKTNAAFTAQAMADIEKTNADTQVKIAETLQEVESVNSLGMGALGGLGAVAGTAAAMAIAGSVVPGIGTAIGAVIGGAVGLIGAAVADATDLKTEDLERVVEAYQKDADLFTLSNEEFAKKTGISNEAHIKILKENSDKLAELSLSMEAATQAEQLTAETMAKNYLDSQGYTQYDNSKFQDKIIKLIANNAKTDSKFYKDALKVWEDKNDDEAREAYAEMVGATHREGDTYTINGVETDVDLVSAEAALAARDAMEASGSEYNVNEIVSALESIVQISQEKGIDDEGALLSAFAGGKGADLSFATQKQINALKELDLSSIDSSVLSTLQMGDTEALSEQIEISINNYKKEIEKIQKDFNVFTNEKTQDIFKSFAENSNLTLTAQKSIAEALKNAFSVGGDEGVELLANILEKVPDEFKEQFATALDNIDWSAPGALSQLKIVLKEIGVAIPESNVDTLADMLRDAALQSGSLTEALNKSLDAIARINSLSKDLKIGEIISVEDYQEMLAIAPEIEKMFARTAEGYKFLGTGTEQSLDEILKDAAQTSETLKADMEQAEKNLFIADRVSQKDYEDFLSANNLAQHDNYLDSLNYVIGRQVWTGNRDENGEAIYKDIISEIANLDMSQGISFGLSDPSQQKALVEALSAPGVSSAQDIQSIMDLFLSGGNSYLRTLLTNLKNDLSDETIVAEYEANYRKQNQQNQLLAMLNNEGFKTASGWSDYGLKVYKEAIESGEYFSNEIMQQNVQKVLEQMGIALQNVEEKSKSLREAEESRILDEIDSLSELEKEYRNNTISFEAYSKLKIGYLYQEAEQLGYTTDEYERYVQYLQETQDLSQEQAQELALLALKQEKTVNDLTSSWETWKISLTQVNPGEHEYEEAVSGIRAALSNILDTEVSEEFIAENIQLFDDLANGVEGSFERLQAALTKELSETVSKDMTDQEKEEFDTFIDDLIAKTKELEFGDTLPDSLSTALVEMLDDTELWSEEMFDILKALGLSYAQLMNYQTLLKAYAEGDYSKAADIAGDLAFATDLGSNREYSQMRNNMPSNLTDQAYASNIINFLSSHPELVTATITKVEDPGGDGNKGSGGGNAADPDQMDLLEEERDIYHDINVELKVLSNNLEKVQTEQEKLAGKNLIDNLNQQLVILEQQVSKQREKLAMQKQEQKDMQAALKMQGVEFYDDGTVANYNEALNTHMAAVNAAITYYNSLSAEAQEAYQDQLDNIKEEYEKFKEDLEYYEQLTLDDIHGLEQEISDAISKQIELKIEAFDIKVQIELDYTELQRDWNDFLKDLNLAESDIFGRTESDLRNLDTLLRDIDTRTKAANETTQDFLEGLVGSEDSRFVVNGVFDEAAAREALLNHYNELQDELLNTKQLINDTQRSYLEAMDQAQEKLDKQIESYEFINDLLNHGLKMTELLGGEDAYEEMAKYYEDMASNYEQQADMLRKEKSMWAEEIERAKAALAAEQAKPQEERDAQTEEILQEQLDKAVENWRAATQELNDITASAVENLQAQYENSIDLALQRMADKLTNGKGLDYIAKEWELINDNADRYLDTVNSTYEVQALQSKYMQAINNTDSSYAQKKLNEAMEEELKALREKDKLTQYDIDRANKKYDITLKQIALEEAQQNASSMRLRRDSQGNYSYQFVADEDAVAKAEQDLLAAQNDLYNFDKDAYEKNLDEAYDAYVQFQEDLKEAAMINDPEERAAREALIREQYEQKINDLTAINETIRSNLQESAFDALAGMYNTNEENFKLMNDDVLADFSTLTLEDMPNLMGQLVEGWNTGIQEMITNFADPEEGFSAQCKVAYEDIKTAQDTYEEGLKELGLTAENIFDQIYDDIGEDIEQTKSLMDTNDELISQLRDDLDKQWDLVANQLAILKSRYADLEEAARKALEAMMAVQNMTYAKDTSSGGENSGDTSDPSSDEPGNTDPSQEDDPGSKGKQGKMPSNDVALGVAAAIWRVGNYAGWDNDPVRKAKLTEKFTSDGRDKIQGLLNRVDNGEQNAINRIWSVKDSDLYKYHYDKFDTGGYTGEWGPGGKFAMLHQKEIVLNAKDTENLLSAVNIVRGLGDMVQTLSAALASNLIPAAVPVGGNQGADTIEQNVHITAEFPNVSSSSEIEQALRNLTNVASQRAFNTRR